MAVYLEKLSFNDQNKIIDLIYKDEVLYETFLERGNTLGRLSNSAYTAFIKDEDIVVGFVMLVEITETNTYEVDMGILEKYRNKGYGTIGLSLLKDIIKSNKIKVEIQTKKENKGAIKSILNNGFVLLRNDNECNYYIMESESKKK